MDQFFLGHDNSILVNQNMREVQAIYVIMFKKVDGQ